MGEGDGLAMDHSISAARARTSALAKSAGAALASWGGAARRACVDAIFPPACPLSGEPVARQGLVAPAAWTTLTFLAPPWCAGCGTPFPYDMGVGVVCGACTARPPAYDIARAPLAYDEQSKPLILSLKHAGRLDGVAALSAWMAQCVADIPLDSALIAPVPLHAGRLRKRRFNQSAVLAKGLARHLGRPFDPDILLRKRATPSQAGLSAKARARNVSGAFGVRDTARARVSGADVILVDDVLTTGATVSACARTLKRAGAGRVIVVTAARVVRPREPLMS